MRSFGFSTQLFLYGFIKGLYTVAANPLSLVFEEKTEFLHFSERMNFDEAVARCVNFDSSATLARVDTLEEFNFVLSSLDFDTIPLLDGRTGVYRTWIGLRDENGVPTSAQTEGFTYIDGVQENISFFQEPNVLPWASTRPLLERNGRDCAHWVSLTADPIFHKLWSDTPCLANSDALLCRRDFVKLDTQPLSVVLNDSTEFLYFDQPANFDVASKVCSDFDPDSTLARVDNEEEFDFILNALDFKSLNGEVSDKFSMWIGLNNEEDLGNGAVTSSFSYVDGVQNNISFFETPSQKPWANSQPTAVRTSEQCVSWEDNADSGQFWKVQECNTLLPGFLCRREVKKLEVQPISIFFKEEAEFLLFNQPSTFEVASKTCIDFDPESALARIDTEEEFDFLSNAFGSFISDTPGTFAAWIGLKDENTELIDSPSRFTYVDGNQKNSSFYEIPFEKPWDATQPVPESTGSQRCVSWETAESLNLAWFSNDCRRIQPSFVCRREQKAVNQAVEIEQDDYKTLLYAMLTIIWFLWLMLVALWIRIACSQTKTDLEKL